MRPLDPSLQYPPLFLPLYLLFQLHRQDLDRTNPTLVLLGPSFTHG